MLTFGRGADENSSALSHDDAAAVGIQLLKCMLLAMLKKLQNGP